MGLDCDIVLVEVIGVKYYVDQIMVVWVLFVLECVKKNGLDVIVGMLIYYLMLNELDVVDYWMFFKVKLFLCSEEDCLVIIVVVKFGLIDVISLMYMF